MSSTLNMNTDRQHEVPTKPTSRWISWLILAIIALPMMAAYIIFTTGVGIPTATVNKGDLLLPATSISDLDITTGAQQPLSIPGEKRLWRMLVVGGNTCDQVCQDLLYLSRQVHVRLGEKAVRVERLYLNTAATYAPGFATELAEQHPRLVQAHVNAEQWQQTFAGTSISAHPLTSHHLYVVDQEGFAMMSYDSSHGGSALLDDIKRLLKYSYDD